jgi:AbrB family looped-hinge helix DNA binding protein
MKTTTRVTSKGQVTIPRSIRQRAGIQPGTEVEFVEKRGEIVLRKAVGNRRADRDEEFEAYLERVTGSLDLGMSTDEYMELLRGE